MSSFLIFHNFLHTRLTSFVIEVFPFFETNLMHTYCASYLLFAEDAIRVEEETTQLHMEINKRVDLKVLSDEIPNLVGDAFQVVRNVSQGPLINLILALVLRLLETQHRFRELLVDHEGPDVLILSRSFNNIFNLAFPGNLVGLFRLALPICE